MSVNDRLSKLEEKLAGDWPTWSVCCKRRWTFPQWFKRLSRQADMGRVRRELAKCFADSWPKDDAELRRELATCPADFEPTLPPGAVPCASENVPLAGDNAAGKAQTNNVRVH